MLRGLLLFYKITTVISANNLTVYAHWELIDNNAPTLSRTGVNYATGAGGGGVYYQLTYSASDAESGVSGYYWGTTYPTATNVSYTSWTGGSISKTIILQSNIDSNMSYNYSGTYYFAVKDVKGNVSVNQFNYMILGYGNFGLSNNITLSGLYDYAYAIGNNATSSCFKNPSGACVCVQHRNNNDGCCGVMNVSGLQYVTYTSKTGYSNGNYISAGTEAICFAAWK